MVICYGYGEKGIVEVSEVEYVWSMLLVSVFRVMWSYLGDVFLLEMRFYCIL